MATPNPALESRANKKPYIWVLTVVTYALVIVSVVGAAWAYRYFLDKARREQHNTRPVGEELRPQRAR